MIVTIDGPAGAGKSSAARGLAARLDFDFLDTGAMYRAVTLAAIRSNLRLTDEAALAALLPNLQLDMPQGRVILNGEDVSTAIRTPQVTERSREAADNPVVRCHLSQLQRRLAAGRNIVTEGRDQGTVVFPDAECKFFLTAEPRERARRRYLELTARGQDVTFVDVFNAQQERDAQDEARSIAPMVPAGDAVILDSTNLAPEEVLHLMERHVRDRIRPTSLAKFE
jgi:cytidylate kinase